MATRIFDRETLLDLVVNAVPLFILGFFVAAFALFAPFGVDPLASGIQFALVVVPFVLLLGLTYISARAIAGAEKNGPVFLPGQTTPAEARPLEEQEDEAHEYETGDEAAGETGDGAGPT